MNAVVTNEAHQDNPMEMDETNMACLDRLIYEQTGEHLSDLQRVLIREIWQGPRKTYEQIALEYNYSDGYIRRVVGPKLWQLLSQLTDQKVTKTNLRSVLEPILRQQVTTAQTSSHRSTICSIEIPGESVPLGSPFYLERQPYEPACYDELRKPGALLRIKGPRQMGKTSLMRRLMAQAQEAGYQTVYLNFQQIERDRLKHLDSLLRWCCANIAYQLQLEPQLQEHWDEDIGSKISCTLYLEHHILESLQAPLVLALEEISELMEEPAIAKEFLIMLRTWYEHGKNDPLWRKLRLIMAQSTEMYVHLNVNQSPFNVGFGITLEPFSLEQTAELSQKHPLQLSGLEIEQLHQFVGGHPYLVRLFLYHLVLQQTNFQSLYTASMTDEGIYRDHLHRHLWIMHKFPELQTSFKKILVAGQSTLIKQVHQFKLQSLGLVRLNQNHATISCKLYQKYFSDKFECKISS